MPETAYRKECRKRCEWCAKGSKASVDGGTVHKVYPMNASDSAFRDPSILTKISQYFRCTAPTLAQFSEEQAAELEEAKSAIRGLLVMMDRGDCPQKLYAALTWVENDELARKNAELVLNKPVIVPDSEVRKNA